MDRIFLPNHLVRSQVVEWVDKNKEKEKEK
jgi:hypothetical protein